jgi:hypothetical protein
MATKPKFVRVMVNRMIDGVLVVCLENVRGIRATQVRVLEGATQPLSPMPKATEFWMPGEVLKDVELANKLGAKAAHFIVKGE